MNLISELMDTIERQKVADLLTTRPARKAAKPIKLKQEVEVKKREARPTSRGKKQPQRPRSKSTSACSVCDGHSRSQSRTSRRSSRSRSRGRGQFLEQLLTSDPSETERINYENKKSVFNAVTNQQTPSLFDIYLDEAKKRKTAASPDLNESGYNTNMNTSSMSSMSSMFDDIKDVLKAVEYSKAKIDANDANRLKPRDDRMFHILNDASRSEQLRLKKLVDGCVSAIASDVKKAVSQKLDDEEKNKTANLKSQSRRPSVTKQPKTDDKKPTGPAISNINKYLGQVYGKSLIEQIKKERIEEKSRISKEKAEKSRQEEEDKEKKRRMSRLQHQATKKPIKPVKTPAPPPPPVQLVDDYNQQRPAFVSVPIVPMYPENNVHSFGEIKRIRSPERTSSGVKQTEEYYYSKETRVEEEIFPETSQRPGEENVIDKDDDEDNKGYGIELNGAKKPASSNTSSGTTKNQPGMSNESNETAEFMKERSYLEKQTLDWLDQQIVDRFLKQLTLNQVDEETSESYTAAVSDYYKDEDSESDQSMKLNDLVNMIGQRGMQLFVDVGAPVDQNLIEALCLQVLGEKVSSMINKSQDVPNISELVDHRSYGALSPPQKESIDNKATVQPPISPRRTVDFLSKQNRDQDLLGLDVQTPVPTPPRTHSPINIQSTPKPVDTPIQPTMQPQLFKFVQVYNNMEDDDDEFEVTLNDSDQDDVPDNNLSKINTISIIVPPTPKETPTSSPRSEARPIHKEEPVVVKTLVTTGVQCDPEPKPEPIIIKEPVPIVPEPRKESPVIEKPKSPPVVTKKDVSIQQTFNETTQLTDSTKYSTDMEASTTTMTTETCEEEEEDYNDSYFSDGAWLMSKSEGQIELVDHEVYVNLDMQMAVKGMILNPRKTQPSVTESDGEIKIDQLNEDNMLSYGGKPRTGVNRITQAAEEGQVDFVSQVVKEIRAGNDKSEGEISNPATKEPKPLTTCSKKQQNSFSLKDQIKINAIPNEILVKDSNEFVRKIYSSTPDQSMMMASSGGINLVTVSQTSVQLINQVMLDDDENLEEDYEEEDEHEISLNLDDSPHKPHRYEDNDDDDDTLNNTN